MSDRQPSKLNLDYFEDEEFFGVYATEDDSGCPVAMFNRLDDAQKWLKQLADSGELGCDYCIIKTTVVRGEFPNDTDALEPTPHCW